VTDRRPMGSLERAVLEQLWAHEGGATPGEIRAALEVEVGYTTVTTVLARLVEKGQVERAGRGFRYRALSSEAELAARRMQEALKPVQDRPLVLSRFVDGLTDGDEQALRQILDELDR
jgi:predicted transcriptional regulator